MQLGSLWFEQSKSWSQKDASSSLLHTIVEVYQISTTYCQGYCSYEQTDNLLGEEVATALKGIPDPSEIQKNHKNVDTVQQLKLIWNSQEKENVMHIKNLAKY